MSFSALKQEHRHAPSSSTTGPRSNNHNHDHNGQRHDVELGALPTSDHLANHTVSDFHWSDLSVTVKSRATKQPMRLLDAATGTVRAGEMLAIMGPSGSGKTTLLNALAHRVPAAGATAKGDIRVNGRDCDAAMLRDISTYVEQEDALIGSLTVRETMMFAARLALPRGINRREAMRRVDDLIASFGLQARSNTIVGTPIKKGLSGGQKKRLDVASRLITNPKILFLDEPTSGLDSALSLEVMSYIRDIARRNHLVVIASIHQPSSSTFRQFDKLCLLSGGRTCYFGPTQAAPAYFSRYGYEIPPQTNAPEFYLDLINTDLDRNGEVEARTNDINHKWRISPERSAIDAEIHASLYSPSQDPSSDRSERPGTLTVPLVLLHRSWIKSYRDIIAYGIRIIMYLGLAIMMGTVFLRLQSEQKYILPFINAIFFGGAFMSFMAVAYVPAFLEDLHTYKQERANGLVGPGAFMVANFLIGIPFLFLIALLFSIVTYWLSNFRSGPEAFFRWVMWLFLDLLAAESLVVLVSNIFPIFVVALAVTAFANGLWMCVDGFLVPMTILNPFWKYVFHYIDYQAYVFQGMMVNEFEHREYDCVTARHGYQCMYPSDLSSVGKIRGTAVLKSFDISTGQEGTWVGIIIAIIAGYRLLAYLVLVLRR